MYFAAQLLIQVNKFHMTRDIHYYDIFNPDIIHSIVRIYRIGIYGSIPTGYGVDNGILVSQANHTFGQCRYLGLHTGVQCLMWSLTVS